MWFCVRFISFQMVVKRLRAAVNQTEIKNRGAIWKAQGETFQSGRIALALAASVFLLIITEKCENGQQPRSLGSSEREKYGKYSVGAFYWVPQSVYVEIENHAT